MALRRWVFVAAMCTLLSMGCFGGAQRVQNPAPVAAGVDLDTTEQTILDVLPKRGWAAETVEPGRILAFLSVRQFLLRVEIRYDADKVTIAYVDSDKLGAYEKNGDVYAHRKVTGWMKNLARDIQAALAAASQGAPAATRDAAAAPSSGGESDGDLPDAP